MDTTRASLLIRVKDPRDTEAWGEFYELYAPLLYRYARARGLGHDEAEEVRGICLEAIVRQIADFQYDKQKGGFKAWLRTMVNRRVIDRLRRRNEQQADTRELRELADQGTDPDALWEQHWRQQHLRYCVELVRDHVTQQTYEAFRLLVQEELDVPDVCDRLGMNRNQVYKAKARMLTLVRDKMKLLDPV